MRVCFIAHQATKEGAGRFMLDQIDYLLMKGIAVFVILPRAGPLCDALAARGVDVRLVPYQWWTRAALGTHEPNYGEALAAAGRIAALFHEWRIDVAYTQTIVVPSGALAAALAGIPHVWHIHEFSYIPGVVDMAIPKETLARLIGLTSNFTFFNSKAVAAEWSDLIPPEKSRLLYNWSSLPADDDLPDSADAVALELLKDDDVFVAVIVGSVLRWKRQIDAVRAIANLRREGRNVALLVVGPPADSGYAAEVVEAAGRDACTDRIRFVGYVENPQRIMRLADVTIVCSDREPFGRVTVESMAQGTPVIGADSGGTPEIIDDGVDGLLFPTGDVDALTDRLRRFIQDRALRSRLAVGARDKARRFQDPESTMGPILELLNSLVGQKNPSWPLGTVIGAGLPGLGTFGSASLPPEGERKGRLRNFFRRRNDH